MVMGPGWNYLFKLGDFPPTQYTVNGYENPGKPQLTLLS